MSFQAYPTLATEQETRRHIVRLLGTGAAAPTVELGHGITVSRTAAGRYLLDWASNPGAFLGFTFGLQAATPGNLAGHTVQVDEYDSATKSLEVNLRDAADALHDLAASEWIYLEIVFKLTGP